MKIVHVSFFYDESLATEEELIQQHYTITGWAEALQRQQVKVIVMNRFCKDSIIQKNNVYYYFIDDSMGGKFRGWTLPLKFLRKIASLDADVIHLHNLTLSLQTWVLRRMLNQKTAIIIQHHGGKAPGRSKRVLHNLLNRVADGFFFTTREQGDEWFMKKRPFKKILPVMEGATYFNYADRDSMAPAGYYDRTRAREKTGLKGSPVFLWVGRFDENKDPLTVLEGFEIIFEKLPAAALYMIYNDSSLSDAVTKRVSGSGVLKDKVHLLGKIPHPEIEPYYQSADYFVLGSHYEGSGYALGEALRCGCIPVVTNIPSFRMMTNGGKLGGLWETGDKNSFAETVTAVLCKPLRNEAAACIDFFNATLSFDAIAGIAREHYQKVIDNRSKK